MQNWIGIGIWIVMGVAIGLAMKVLIKRPEETQGHTMVLVTLGASFVLGEQVSRQRWLAIFFIVVGIVMVSVS